MGPVTIAFRGYRIAGCAQNPGRPEAPLCLDIGANRLQVYIAVILDAWSRRVVGYAISLSIDARLTLAALSVAIEGRNPTPPQSASSSSLAAIVARSTSMAFFHS
jgi:transposase InsO family protein